MTNECKASRSVFRKQRVKTAFSKLIYIPIVIATTIKIICLILMVITGWFAVKKMKNALAKSSNRLMLQRENYKPIKKNHKLDKKQMKKQLKASYNSNEEVEQNVKELNKD